jgi:hypothetical protein
MGVKIEKKYATATGLYNREDFDGPPPFAHDEVYSSKSVDELLLLLSEYLKLSSIDGKIERQNLRKRLQEYVK